MAFVIAIGVRSTGEREVSWALIFASLRMVHSGWVLSVASYPEDCVVVFRDAHEGLRNAILGLR